MASASAAVAQRNSDATLWVGNVDDRVDTELLWELFVQVGPVVEVFMPCDKVNGKTQGFAFVEFRTEADADYAARVMNMVPLHGKNLRVRRAGEGSTGVLAATREVGATLFVGNLDGEATDKTLFDTFSAFGVLLDAKVSRDLETGVSRGFGFVSYDSFEASDAAIEALAGQYLSGRPVSVQYAFRKDVRGERHGSVAERTLAAAQRSAMAGGGGGGSGGLHKFFASASGVVEPAVPGLMGGGAAGGVRMLGAPVYSAPPMLPPTAIMGATLMPPPPPGVFGALGGLIMPPPLPPNMTIPSPLSAPHAMMSGGRGMALTQPAWMTRGAA